MGACVSAAAGYQKMPEVGDDSERECFMCSTVYTRYIELGTCKHRHHAECLLAWWAATPSNCYSCPMCRQASTGCCMQKTTNRIVGYYRRDNVEEQGYVLVDRDRANTEPTEVINLPDEEARDLALNAMLFMQIKDIKPAGKDKEISNDEAVVSTDSVVA